MNEETWKTIAYFLAVIVVCLAIVLVIQEYKKDYDFGEFKISAKTLNDIYHQIPDDYTLLVCNPDRECYTIRKITQ